jgi:transcriptional regulator with XRE-family HTH domain
MPPTDWSLAALHAALDARRSERGLTWAQVAREINALAGRVPVRALSPSTLAGFRLRSVAEADGVLQALRWLDRTPESFLPGPPKPGARLPAAVPGRILRVDASSLHAALDGRRRARGLTWAALAAELGTSARSLTRLAAGGRVAFPEVMRLTGWLGRPLAEFTRAVER